MTPGSVNPKILTTAHPLLYNSNNSELSHDYGFYCIKKKERVKILNANSRNIFANGSAISLNAFNPLNLPLSPEKQPLSAKYLLLSCISKKLFCFLV